MKVLIKETMRSPFGCLALRRTGEGAPLLLLHGGAGSWTHWSRNIGRLARDFTVHAVDLPGCGESPDVPAATTPDQYMAGVAEAVSTFDCADRLYMTGFSFGAAVAARIAALLPERITRLALVGPGGFGSPECRALNLKKVPSGGPRELIWAALRHNLLQMMLASPESVDEQTLKLHHQNVMRARFDSRKVSLGVSLLEDLPRIRCPIAVIWGAHDSLAYPSVAGRALTCRGLNPRLTTEVIPDAGHWVQHESAAAFNRALGKFLLAPEHPLTA